MQTPSSLNSSAMGWDFASSMEFTNSPSTEFTSSPSTLSEFSIQAAALPYRPRCRRVEMVMVHDPYTYAAYKQIPMPLPQCPEYSVLADGAQLDASDTQSQSDCECDCDGVGECDVELEADNVEGDAGLKKRIRKKKVKCPNGHRAAKRLRYRKGQSHYSCLECLIRWKA